MSRVLPQMEMPYAVWVGLPDHPLQRDTVRHAKKTAKTIHRVDHPTQRVVSGVRIGTSGRLYKADGHTRTLHWVKGQLVPPDTVLVQIYEADDIDDFNAYYRTHDNPDATEQTHESLFGIFRAAGLEFQTPRLRDARVASALSEAWGWVSLREGVRDGSWKIVEDQVKEWADELHLIDSLRDPLDPSTGVKTHGHNNAMIAAMLLTFRRYGAQIKPFWAGVAQGLGRKDGKERDPVQAACEILTRKYQGGEGMHEPTERLLSATVAWLDGRTYKTLPNRSDINEFRVLAERAKRSRIKRAG